MGKTGDGPKTRKPYEEIGAIFNGNEVKIRIPKSTSKPPKLTPSQLKLQNQCTCDDEGSVCSETCGFPGEPDGGPANRLNFQIPDDICEAYTNRTALNSELVYSKKEAHETLCNVCNVTPKDAPKGVEAQKVLHPDKDVFVLKIGKQTDEPNRTGNIETPTNDITGQLMENGYQHTSVLDTKGRTDALLDKKETEDPSINDSRAFQSKHWKYFTFDSSYWVITCIKKTGGDSYTKIIE